MKTWKILFFVVTIGFGIVGCGNEGSSPGSAASDSEITGETDANSSGALIVMEGGGLKISATSDASANSGAKLGLINPPAGADLAAGTNRFEFSADNFEFGKATPGDERKGIAVNPQGQYAALILNNGPLIQMNAATSDQKLDDGHYVMLAFPSLSFHESVKTSGGHILRKFNVGQPENYKEIDLKAPHLFYHWPNGVLKGQGETTKVLLDFYLVNCTLGPDNYKVKATINGTEFILSQWTSYTIEGLPMGENKIKLELLDATGISVASPFNPVERTFTLQAGA